ncbi:hypothetical protein B5F55_09525 [Anaerotruncus colihominis]|nr:hypothetical protein B5F55_09525 [Anaerotruncus colihominis]
MNLTFFEKKVSQKTLVGCAANSGVGSGFLQAAPRTVGRVPDFYRLRREQWGGFRYFYRLRRRQRGICRG